MTVVETLADGRRYRYTDSDGFRLIAGVLISLGTRCEKWDDVVRRWVYLDTLPPGARLITK